jgi:hypothetical protein
MKPSFIRMRKRRRAVLVLPSHLAELAPHLRRRNFLPIVPRENPADPRHKECLLSHRTLVTDKPEELDPDDVAVFEFSVICIGGIEADAAGLADIISRAWAKFRLKTEGWFVLRLRQDGKHQIEFPE